jgi:CRP-like cAMP-binding protein
MSKDAKYYTIHVDQFRELMFNNPMLCFNVLQLVGDRLIHTETRLESMVLKDAKTRVIDFLKGLLTKQGRKVGFEMLIKHSFTQQDIANITGTSRQTVTSVLNELKKSKSIQFNRNTILVRDMARL